jgi:hypothetical protein
MLQFLRALQSSMLVKVAGLFFLLLLLCIPLAEIDSINRGRGESQREAAQSWPPPTPAARPWSAHCCWCRMSNAGPSRCAMRKAR